MSNRDIEQTHEEILGFSDRLHQSGCAPYSVSEYTKLYAQNRNVDISIDVTPTKVITVFQKPVQNVVIETKKPPSVNLRNLVATLDAFSTKATFKPAEKYSNRMLCLANVLLPPCYLMLVGSTYFAVGISVILGLIAWLAQVTLQGEKALLVEFFVALIASFFVGILAAQYPELPTLALCISSIVLFIPGLTVTNALGSLALNDFRSGIELLAQSTLVVIKIFIGIVLGLSLSSLITHNTAAVEFVNEIPLFLHILALIGISVAIGIVFNASMKDIIIGLPATAIGMWGPHWFTSDWVVGTWISTILITLYGLAAGKIRQIPPLVYIIQGIIILVPGSRIIVGASESFFATAILPIPNIAMSALLMFCSIVAGQIMVYSFFYRSFSPTKP
ncbi:threonine/serine exporter family protein [Vibrio algarum]|uniref:Threonine/serine exporter family protein n=1 Tax=Vibrio algarum TaxID=3020714 RepID=A0ABT4YUN4_9VIBR|nr:threonine/serine exporter family protein [Vibrio sp. KJ40-1]MDB1125170.1 threonine/serine exporter family protein [Vibrio sp. KJ40-1]